MPTTSILCFRDLPCRHALARSHPGPRTALGPVPGAAGSAAIAELARGRGQTTRRAGPELGRRAWSSRVNCRCSCNPICPCFTLPDWETLPYDHFSPHQDIVSQRLRTLYELPESRPGGLVILPITTAMLRTPPQHYVEGNTLDLAHWRYHLICDALHQPSLTLNGYRCGRDRLRAR